MENSKKSKYHRMIKRGRQLHKNINNTQRMKSNMQSIGGETIKDEFDESFYKHHLLYPLVGLYPLQIDLHWLLIFMRMSPRERANDIFEEMVGKRPPWPFEFKKGDEESELLSLYAYINAYKEKCQTDERCDKNCVFYRTCKTRSQDRKYGWCKGKKYAPLKKPGNLPKKMQVSPSAYDIMNHQVEWLEELLEPDKETKKKETNELKHLKYIIKSNLIRFLKVRDTGEKYETFEVSAFKDENDEPEMPGFDQKFSLEEQEVANFCDHMLEEIEDICTQIDQPFSKLQEKVDRAQAYVKDGFEKLKLLNVSQKKLFAPLQANIYAFLESFDRVLHRFKANDLEDQDEILFMMELPLEKSENKMWYQAFCQFTSKNKKRETIAKDTGKFFLSRYWSFAALGPRILVGLYLSTINQSYTSFDYFKARNYLNALKRFFLNPLTRIQKVKLFLNLFFNKKANYFKRVAGLKENDRRIRQCYLKRFSLPFVLKIILGIGLLFMLEMDYTLVNEYIYNSTSLFFPGFLVLLVLFIGSFAGAFSLTKRGTQFRNTLELFKRLLICTILPSFLIFLIFPDLYNYPVFSYIFLILGSIFFAIVINTIGSKVKE